MRPRLDRLPSGSTVVVGRVVCDHCGLTDEREPTRVWRWITNGDGATVQQCKGCGTCYAVGRWWSDSEVGIQLPGAGYGRTRPDAFSTLSVSSALSISQVTV